ncbi:MAG: SRPBCC family protein [Planctomycetota bacterium]
MPSFEIETPIDADPLTCFDLARDIDFHVRSLVHTGEQAIAGVTTGLIGLDETVTFRGKHFGVTQHLTSRITRFDPPHHFRDEMTHGAFKRFAHDHFFDTVGSGTVMRDHLEFASPFGPIGFAVDRAFMTRYLRKLLAERAHLLKIEAEQQNR